jgi:hypothetical protein
VTATDYLEGLAWASAALLFALTVTLVGWTTFGYAASHRRRKRFTQLLRQQPKPPAETEEVDIELLGEYGIDRPEREIVAAARWLGLPARSLERLTQPPPRSTVKRSRVAEWCEDLERFPAGLFDRAAIDLRLKSDLARAQDLLLRRNRVLQALATARQAGHEHEQPAATPGPRRRRWRWWRP